MGGFRVVSEEPKSSYTTKSGNRKRIRKNGQILGRLTVKIPGNLIKTI